MNEDDEKEGVEDLRKLLNLNGIDAKAGSDNCINMKEENGVTCRMDCPYFKDCDFFAAMCIDFVGSSLAPNRFPNGFISHLFNSIEMHRAGIRVGFVEISEDDVKPEDF